MKLPVVALLSVALLPTGLLPMSSARADAADSPAAAPITALDAGLTALEKSGSKPFPERYAQFAPVVDQVYDLPGLIHKIVGQKWDDIAPADQKTLLDVFRAYTICNYVANFNTDSGTQFVLLPEVRNIGPNSIVETQIVPKNGDPVRMDYVMRPNGAVWQAIDVLATGTISQAAVQRSDFRSALEQGGAAKLADSLRAKVRMLSGGTINP